MGFATADLQRLGGRLRQNSVLGQELGVGLALLSRYRQEPILRCPSFRGGLPMHTSTSCTCSEPKTRDDCMEKEERLSRT